MIQKYPWTGPLAGLLLSLCAVFAYGQDTLQKPATPPAQPFQAKEAIVPPPLEVDHSYKPLVAKLNADGSKFVRFIIWNQFWATATENNPNTVTDLETGEVRNTTYDIALRRARFLAYAQISPRFLILTHFGINNQSFINGGVNAAADPKKPQLFFHDVWNEFAVIPGKLHIGSGLHYWHGVSRLTSASTLNFMTLDAPIFNWPTIEATDQFARQFGVYAKGKLGKLDYRVAINKPFVNGPSVFTFASGAITGVNPDIPLDRAINVRNDNFAVQGYFMYQFLDQESNVLPFTVGTYHGTKSIFNIGAGFYHHPDASGQRRSATEVDLQNHSLWSVDVFWEKPFANGSGLSLYSVWYDYDFGNNYIRNVGILNNGGNNAQPTIGTGNIWYTQLGFALPKLSSGGQFMPYVTATYKDFEGLNDTSFQYDAGLNYFINSHHAKLTLQYSARPTFDAGRNFDQLRGQWILQTHIFL